MGELLALSSLHLMRMVAYAFLNTVVQVQPGVLVIGWQVVAPDGLFTAISLKAGDGPTSSCALFCIKVVEDHESGQDAPSYQIRLKRDDLGTPQTPAEG